MKLSPKQRKSVFESIDFKAPFKDADPEDAELELTVKNSKLKKQLKSKTNEIIQLKDQLEQAET